MSALILILTGFLLISSPAIGAEYDFEIISLPGPIPDMQYDTVITDINNHGVMVGAICDPEFTCTTFYLVGKKVTPIELSPYWGPPSGINDDKDITSQDENGGYLLTWTKKKQFNITRFLGGYLTDLNNLGWVVEVIRSAAGNYSSYLWADGIMTEIKVQEMDSTLATGINDSGRIVGYAYTVAETGSWPLVGFITDNGKDFTLVPDVRFSGINNYNEVIGTYSPPIGEQRHFIYRDGVFDWVTIPNYSQDEGTLEGINDNGWIVGRVFIAGDDTQSYIGKPIKKKPPKPAPHLPLSGLVGQR